MVLELELEPETEPETETETETELVQVLQSVFFNQKSYRLLGN